MSDAGRHLRSLHDANAASFDRLGASTPEPTPMMLGRVVDGGALPTTPDRFCLVNPVDADGVEAEGGPASLIVDPTRRVPVLVLNDAPKAGDYLQAFATGGFWIAEKGLGEPCTEVCKPPPSMIYITCLSRFPPPFDGPVYDTRYGENPSRLFSSIPFVFEPESGQWRSTGLPGDAPPYHRFRVAGPAEGFCGYELSFGVATGVSFPGFQCGGVRSVLRIADKFAYACSEDPFYLDYTIPPGNACSSNNLNIKRVIVTS